MARVPIEGFTFERYRMERGLERLAWIGRLGLLISRLHLAGDTVVIVNTHLPANYDEEWSETNRYVRRQLKELGQLADALCQLPDHDLLVVAGDFNVPVSSDLFADFLGATGLVSAVDWTTWPPSGRVYHGIDNVLFRPPAGRKISATSRLHLRDPVRLADGRTAFASDHMGVEVELQW